jgi:hypothetical protein
MSIDTVKWWGGQQFGIVPRACVKAIIAAAAHIPNVSGPTAVAVLTALAVGAGRDGASNGGQAGAADLLGMSPASVRRVVASVLEPAGVATRTRSGGVVLHLPNEANEARQPARQGAPASAKNAPPSADTTRHTARASTTEVETDVSPDSQTPLTPTTGQFALVGDSPPAAGTGTLTLVGFDAFWRVFPRKVGKPSAKRAWDRAIRRANPADIIAGAELNRDDPNREDEFTKHPGPWLNDDRWEAPPLPPRGGTNKPKTAMAQNIGTLREIAANGRRRQPQLGAGS